MGIIKRHSYDVTDDLDFMGRPRGGMYFGVELEVEVSKQALSTCCCDEEEGAYDEDDDSAYTCSQQRAAAECLALLGRDFVVIKGDGSLTHGIEIVSAPASLTVHAKQWREFFASPPSALKVANTCGMHVHMTRSVFTAEQLGKMSAFVTDVAIKPAIVKIAGRSNPYFASLRKKSPECAKADCTWAASEELRNAKYDAVNLCNKPTVELRIFASTLDATKFFVNLEFAAALGHYFRKLPAGSTAYLDWQRFADYAANDSTYPTLTKFMLDSKLLSCPPLTAAA